MRRMRPTMRATALTSLKRRSQRELAQALDVQESTLSEVLSGKRELPVALAEALGFESQGRWYTRKQSRSITEAK